LIEEWHHAAATTHSPGQSARRGGSRSRRPRL